MKQCLFILVAVDDDETFEKQKVKTDYACLLNVKIDLLFFCRVNASINTHVWEFSLTHCNEAFEIMVQLVSIGSRQKIAQG